MMNETDFEQGLASPRPQQGGYVLLIALAILAGILTLGLSMLHNASSGRKIMAESRKGSQSRYAAESAISLLINRAANSVDSDGYLVEFPSTTLNFYGHNVTVNMDVEQNDHGSDRVDSIRSKFNLMTFRSYATIDAISTDTLTKSSAHIRQRIAFDQYPLFQFAIYWEGVMLLDPGSPMSINGRIHCNSRVKLFPGSTLSIEDWLTSPCEIWNMAGGGSSRIRIIREDNVLPSTYWAPPSGFAPIDTPYYHTSPLKRVKAAMGRVVPVFKMPIGTRNPILIIQPKGVSDVGATGFTETATTKRQKFVYKADLLFRRRNSGGTVINQWYRNNPDGSDGTVSSTLNTALNLSIAAPLPNPAVNTTRTLWDYGDQVAMNPVFIDVGTYFANSTNPADEVVYFEGQFNAAAGRRDVFVFYNASTLAHPVTFASNCPVYIWGNYNDINTKSTAIVADLITALSSKWLTTYNNSGTFATYTNRVAANGAIYACLMGGVHRSRVDPTWNDINSPNYYNWNQVDNASYSDRIGQPHNHMAFMENWSGFTMTYQGSLVALWRCLYITGNFRFNPGNNVYTQPTRNYGFDTRYNSLKNMPPGTPTMISPFNLDYYEVHEE